MSTSRLLDPRWPCAALLLAAATAFAQADDRDVRKHLLEEMQEGAVTVDQKGLVVYANRRFAEVLGAPLESVMGSSFHDYICTADQASVQSFLRNESNHAEKIEVSLRIGHQLVPVFLTASPFVIDHSPAGKFLCIVITCPGNSVSRCTHFLYEWILSGF